MPYLKIKSASTYLGLSLGFEHLKKQGFLGLKIVLKSPYEVYFQNYINSSKLDKEAIYSISTE